MTGIAKATSTLLICYPTDLPSAQYLSWYVRYFKTVEINNCFYRLPTEAAVERWHEETPADFCFAVKGSRFITHIKRLRDPEAALATYLSRMESLEPRLGPMLFQLPPNWRVNRDRPAKVPRGIAADPASVRL
ncbi:MAG: hypothetical protein DMG70_21535 [Acidobacteria bacterium]|nr:MAG: hypothetical protein DMG70_21535 [Acidobacteriota bacterium]